MATPAERAATIWTTLGNRVGAKTTYTLNGVAITATLVAVDQAAGSVTLNCSATTGSGQNKRSLPLGAVNGQPDANSFVFVNPITGIYDADGVTVLTGGSYTLTAAKQMVYDAVVLAARARGWTG